MIARLLKHRSIPACKRLDTALLGEGGCYRVCAACYEVLHFSTSSFTAFPSGGRVHFEERFYFIFFPPEWKVVSCTCTAYRNQHCFLFPLCWSENSLFRSVVSNVTCLLSLLQTSSISEQETQGPKSEVSPSTSVVTAEQQQEVRELFFYPEE